MSRLDVNNRAFSNQMLISSLLAVSLILINAELAFSAKSNRVGKDFLPPVASINPKIDASTAEDPNDLEAVTLSAVTTPTLTKTPRPTRLEGNLKKQYLSDDMETVLQLQQSIDEADLDRLWAATVEKNPVIRFSLEKIATPADLQDKNSSKFLKKTISTALSGATLAAQMLPGASGYQNMATAAVGQGLQNIIAGRTQPTGVQLSDTEKIQMANLIDELKIKLIQNYQNYKNTLQTLANSHQVTVTNNNLYSKALASRDNLSIMATGAAYYKALKSETILRQQAKIYRMQLERLAGEKSVADLELAVMIPDANANTAASSNTTSGSAFIQTPTEEPAAPEPLIGPELPELMEIGPTLGRPSSTLPQTLPTTKARVPDNQPPIVSYAAATHTRSSITKEVNIANLFDFAPLDDKVKGGTW